MFADLRFFDLNNGIILANLRILGKTVVVYLVVESASENSELLSNVLSFRDCNLDKFRHVFFREYLLATQIPLMKKRPFLKVLWKNYKIY